MSTIDADTLTVGTAILDWMVPRLGRLGCVQSAAGGVITNNFASSTDGFI